MAEAQRISSCKNVAAQIYTMLASYPDRWQTYLPSARSVIPALAASPSLSIPERLYIIAALQALAFADADNPSSTAATADIANWCQSQWLLVLERQANCSAALRGLGEYWLFRAQPALARIHAAEESAPANAAVSDARLGAPDAVEARGLLTPSSDYLARAVQAAHTAREGVKGELLEKAAEAYMSLGNVSGKRAGEPCFRRALQYLKMAVDMGHELPEHLEDYLDEYGPLVD
ncbi:uncharacterized protein K452DRAFT_314823 [Aplosporella prunicola CBS 121167]|uniref:Uncharacterized protein n=1 Tax=Aplosporella prunicola CBS 121167 TaxID=1176127 RepID=A0A6A6BR27_9PEZI|nr:uncharacterized protein K452DRAFT_314823 [Aplosporella prunicola CBS 121167]KAF2146569.1 hypothetical protein K452DRAFT_314823 [Aplosporella prunicola CBS 121167]